MLNLLIASTFSRNWRDGNLSKAFDYCCSTPISVIFSENIPLKPSFLCYLPGSFTKRHNGKFRVLKKVIFFKSKEPWSRILIFFIVYCRRVHTRVIHRFIFPSIFTTL